jgi:hypothetical protein
VILMMSAKCEWWVEWLNEMGEGGRAVVVRWRQEWSKLRPNAALRISHAARYNCLCQRETNYSECVQILIVYELLLILIDEIGWKCGDFTFMLTRIVMHFFLNYQRDALIIPILFCYKTPHVSGIISAHHQEFSTVHSALASFMQVLITASK